MALRLIQKDGRQLTFKRTTPGAMDVSSGRPGAPVVITAVAWSIVLPFSDRGGKYGADKLADRLYVQVGERLVLVAALSMTVTGATSYTPLSGDDITTEIDGTLWKVRRKETYDPNGSGPIFHAVVIGT